MSTWLVNYLVTIPGSLQNELTKEDLDLSLADDVDTPLGYSEVRFISAIPLSRGDAQ